MVNAKPGHSVGGYGPQREQQRTRGMMMMMMMMMMLMMRRSKRRRGSCRLPVSFAAVSSPLRQSSSGRSALMTMTTTTAFWMMAMAVLLFMSGGSSGGSGGGADAAPIGPPDVYSCARRSSCCLPVPTSPPTAFSANRSVPIRTRPALHSVLQNADYLRKLNAAYAVLRNLSTTDPRSLEQQRRLHCAFCAQLPYGSQYQMHFNWFFLPWHRMLLYYHERILAWACGDSAFALPFWNWDNAAGRAFPSPYTLRNSSLFNTRRKYLPDLQREVDSHTTRTAIRREVVEAETQLQFFGSDDLNRLEGSQLEVGSHGGIHMAVGRSSPDVRDMGSLEWAGNDPIFYAHHANIDRLWTVWLRLILPTGFRRENPSSADFRDSKFVFYDENRAAKIIAVSDVLNHEDNLRYRYEDVTHDWLEQRDFGRGQSRGRRSVPQPLSSRAVPTPNAEGSVVSASLTSPNPTPSSEVVPVVVLRNVRYDTRNPLELHVFMNEPTATADTRREGNPRYVLEILRLAGAGRPAAAVSFNVPIRQTLANLQLTLSSNFTIQVVRGVEVGVPTDALSIESVEYIHETRA